MTFTEFMSILNGEYKETAGASAKNQCVDLANAYIRYVLGFPIIEWTNAVDFPSKAGDNYDYIVNTPEGVPQEGDLVIWGGTYGHIAIFIEGNANRFTSFDENYPVGSPCHVQEHTYLSPKVLGWLRPHHAIITQPISQPQYLKTLLQENNLTNEGQVRDFFQKAINYPGLEKDLENTKKEIQANKEAYNKLLKEYEELEESLKACKASKTDTTQTVDATIVSQFLGWLSSKLRL